MPQITREPIGATQGGTVTRPAIESAPSVTRGTVVREPIESVPNRPGVSDEGSFRQNLERTQVHPDYFNDMTRVYEVGVAEEIVEGGRNVLRGRGAGPGPGPAQGAQDAIKPGLGRTEAVLSDNPIIRTGQEIAGVTETAFKFGVNLVGEGLSSAASVWKAMERGPGIRWDGPRGFRFEMNIDPNKETGFVDDYISAQGAIAAAHGRFYDYEPLMETTDRNLRVVGEFFENTVGAAAEHLGENALEATGSPLLAVAAHMIPDAALTALPFIPRGIRRVRNARETAALEREAAANFSSKIEERGLFAETIDQVANASGETLEGLTGQTTRVRNARGEVVGELQMVDRGGRLQTLWTTLDESQRGHGIGVEMYEHAIARAEARGYPAIFSDTQVSAAAANVYSGLARRNYRVEKNPTAELVTREEFGTTTRMWESGNGQPVYKVVIDEPLDTSSLTPTRMRVDTLNALRGEAAPDPAAVARLADDLRSGKAAGDIIVETVQGTPTRILSGVENLDAVVAATNRAGLRLQNIRVQLQERANLVESDLNALRAQAEAGMQDIIANQRKLELSEQSRNRSIGQRIIHMTADTSGNVKAELLRRAGPLGQAAVRAYTLIAGAVPKAHMMFQDFHTMVYGRRAPSDPGLNFSRQIQHLGSTVSEVDLFNILVQSRRTQAIVRSGGARSSGGQFQLQGAVKPENAAGNVWAIRQTLGETRFAQMNARADQVFQVMHNQLVRLRENGIITEAQFRRMQNIDYIKREFIEALDPVMLQSQVRGSKVSIGESGIYHLRGGSGKAQNIDVQSLVAEYLARTEGRIFRNNANRALLEVAAQVPDNGFVQLPKTPHSRTPQGYTDLRVMVDGEPQRMFMRDLYAGEWVVNDPGMNMAIANFFRIINGTFIVKPLATGINPAFALVNFPRDVMHAWKATGDAYSAFLPRYLGQMFHDLWTVRKDAWNKTGAYRDYINEGGGMNFLTHGGFDPLTGFNRSKDLLRAVGVYRGQFGQSLTRIKEILSKVNEFSEIVVRLGIRNRVLQNQARNGEMPNGPQATFIARDYLDFSQGGSLTKAMESFIPYTNAASQAIRTAYREYLRGGRAAGTAALKDLQVLTVKAAHSSWAWMENPEVMMQVDPHQMYTSLTFPTGLSFTDDRGNRRHLTFNIAMDTSVLPFTALFDRAISRHTALATGIDPNDIPSDHFLGEIASVVPILGSIRTGTPTFQAMAALFSNKDIWANRDIWTGDPFVMPGARRSDNTEGTLFETLGSIAPEVVSPVQLQKAWRSYVPSNFYFDSADFIRKQIQNSADPVSYAEMVQRDTGELTMEMLSQIPGLNRLIHLTHPAAQTTDELRQLATEVATWREIERQAVDDAIRTYRVTGNAEDFTRLVQRVAQVRPTDAEKVVDLFVTGIAVDMMYENNQYDIGFVGQDWFNLLAGQDPEVRAELYYWKSVTLNDENARNLDAVIAQIDQVAGRRIRTDGFETHLRQLMSEYGTRQQRIRAVMDGN